MHIRFLLSFNEIDVANYANHEVVCVGVALQVVHFRLLYIAQISNSEDGVFDGAV